MKTRQKVQLNDFGKMVMHHLIDSEQNLAEFAKKLRACGERISESSLRLLMSQQAERQVSPFWITNTQLPMFMREYACSVHGDELVEMHKVYLSMASRSNIPQWPALSALAEAAQPPAE
jgi:aspartate/tyrosine/aromatic aminotransferase